MNTLVLECPLTLPNRINTRRNRIRQAKRKPLAHLLHIAGIPCYNKESTEAHKQHQKESLLRKRAEQHYQYTTYRELFTVLMLIPIAYSFVLVTQIGPLASLCTMIGSALGFFSLERYCRHVYIRREFSRLMQSPTFGWTLMPYYLYKSRYEIPEDIAAIAQEIKAREPQAILEVEYLDTDPLLWVLLENECYCVGVWD